MNVAGRFFGSVVIAAMVVAAISAARGSQAAVQAGYLYELSDFSGPIPYHWPRLAVDEERGEVYVLDQKERDIRVFGETGMEVYRFGQGRGLGVLLDIAVGRGGEVFAIARELTKNPVILRCNYQGDLVERIELRGFPNGFRGFQAGWIAYRNDRLYLADEGALQVLVVGRDGGVQKGYDLPALLDFENTDEKKTEGASIDGFDVDAEGNFWFTVATLFSAFRVSPEGTVVGFGRPGSAPGKFGVAGGIAAGDDGFVYVTDRLRCVVLVFDHALQFRTEFGYRGGYLRNLIVPRTVAVDSRSGRLYVGQAGKRGVNVYRIVHN